MRRAVVLIALAAVIVIAAAVVPVGPGLLAFLQWVRGTGPWAALLVALIYIPAAIILLPAAPLTLGAGFLFGVVRGTILVSLGSTAGATAAFLVARRFSRGWTKDVIARYPKAGAISRAVEVQGWRVVLLTRLSPVLPYNVLNYAFGLTAVSLREYVLASWVGMLPGTLMYVYLGSAAGSIAELLSGRRPHGTGPQVLFAFGLAATVVVTVLVARTAARALDEIIAARWQDNGSHDMTSSRGTRLFTMEPIGIVHTPFTDTAQIPKGPGAEHRAEGVIDLLPQFEAGLKDIDGFSHLYVLWVFDRASGYDLLATPPTDTRPHGVFATRSPRRPNAIGLTVVALLRREGPKLFVRGVDMLDGTPVLDIKPYLSSVPAGELRRGWLDEVERR